ncbi:hypothetical protein [Sphingomonas sp. TZW2008]|uniref:hypothetical protein n=1 Tax=Sphingomonas sp. TZW2008 TaxID=1917973 RepID=UPI000A27143E|nr:hypothetical protein [Sphingomonas sp. TZW2008]
MLRPPSIVRFEQLYLAAVVIGLANTGFGWAQSLRGFARNPMLAEMTWLLPTLVAVGLVLRLTLWYFTARRPSLVAKWIVVALAAIAAVGLLLLLFALASGSSPSLAATITGALSGVLHIAAAAYLFRDDARQWFGEAADDDLENEE